MLNYQRVDGIFLQDLTGIHIPCAEMQLQQLFTWQVSGSKAYRASTSWAYPNFIEFLGILY